MSGHDDTELDELITETYDTYVDENNPNDSSVNEKMDKMKQDIYKILKVLKHVMDKKESTQQHTYKDNVVTKEEFSSFRERVERDLKNRRSSNESIASSSHHSVVEHTILEERVNTLENRLNTIDKRIQSIFQILTRRK